MKEFISQKQDLTCGAVAIYNAGIHLGIKTPNLEDLIKKLGCDRGKSIGASDVIKETFGNKLICKNPSNNYESSEYFEMFIESGGIIRIQHPVFNLHFVLCLPQEEGFRTYMINSWLGPNVLKVSQGEVKKFLPHINNQTFWLFAE